MRLFRYLLPCLVLSGPAFATGREAVAPAPGLTCMSLIITEQQARDVHFIVPVLHEPQPSSSPPVGRASSIVLARSPVVRQNGYIAVVLFNGTSGWVEESKVMPWHPPGSIGGHCRPSYMSDGSLGTTMH